MIGNTSGTAQAARPPAGADHPLRRLRRHRGLTQTELGELAGLSCSYISMIERGQRTLARLDHITAMAAVLRVPPADLVPGAIPTRADLQTPATPAPDPPFPAMPGDTTMTRHAGLTQQFVAHVARGDTRAAGMWLRRTARDPAVSPWLLLDLLASHHARMGAGAAVMTSTTQPARTPVQAGHPMRRLRRRRGITQAELAALAGVSSSYISMIECGERSLTRLDHITAIAAALRVSPAELAPAAVPAHPDLRASAPSPAPAFPALRNEVTMTRHTRLATQFLVLLASGDTRAPSVWLRRTARDPHVSPWLLLDLLASHKAQRDHTASSAISTPDATA